MAKQQIGVIGMAVMGRNLALNMERNQYTVSIFNRSLDITEKIILNNPNKNLFPFFSIKDFVLSLIVPRCIVLMIKSGVATDDTIKSLIPYLSKGDIIIDGGNTFYKDTIQRGYELLKIGVNLIGAGFSGGEKGALYGPSIMPGGRQEAYNYVSPILKKIASNSEGIPCVTYIGPDGSGHYVKMVHNGIEYGDMQLIAESYFILKTLLRLDNQSISKIFDIWNQGELNSYLIDITKDILIKKDDQNNYLIDCILDEGSSKGTGTWTTKSALDLNEPLTLITESVFFRYLSSLKSQRLLASKILCGPKDFFIVLNRDDFIEKIRQALYLGKIISYAQGFSQLNSASQKYNWNLKLGEISRIFQSGCIIRAKLLKNITQEYSSNNNFVNLLLTPYFREIANTYHSSLREIVSISVKYGIPIPALSSAISYFDSYRSAFLPSNLIQAQRDFFGAHTYKRIDKSGIFHTNWYS
ncbi:6-phosphogluconate dehydrogenase [Buchnera aphidicola str. Bp (Baizongia pistaciae)]|uniref:6-phosphogluconate dehydrogenase, decarboxylating n=1 Tax=Buchnera aphidicola subsp. Baizongia pistaciae (strain Bp) TaxID=224915 RepID=6PGD_BUCBP|nr:NADP-dependent phosphogluconate dehydrogenase [Buchnera aphidicola]Q89AX5.1 RecName: Full=6-phosphogluconate dehydrogenase, decarboxylating [Buchnera aphidicola str. Bp (Baizongia pistaciae)]AAO26836.1 6-phosphogluconate dehydrogenase [Buchnera aphidicola str. Bp (Baizongia pistaciae)]